MKVDWSNKEFKVIYDSVDTDNKTVNVWIEGNDAYPVQYKMYGTSKGWYINLFGKRYYILETCEEFEGEE